MSQTEIFDRLSNHRSHHGSRSLRAVNGPAPYTCALCVTAGSGPRYQCSSCGVSIHRHCGSQLQQTQPCFLHPQQPHRMALQVVRQGATECFVCGKYIAGYHYACSDVSRDARVHPICLLLRFAPSTAAAPTAPVKHWAHGHPLREVFLPKRYDCDTCGFPGWGRRFRCGDCDFNLHPYCFSCKTDQPCCLCNLPRPHDCALQLAPDSSGHKCSLCAESIRKTDTSVGLHYRCKVSAGLAAGHPLCFQLRQLEQQCTSGNADASATAMNVATTVIGRVVEHHIYAKLVGCAFVGGSAFREAYAQSGDVSEAFSAAAENMQTFEAGQVSDVVDAVDAGVSTAGDLLHSFMEVLSNFF